MIIKMCIHRYLWALIRCLVDRSSSKWWIPKAYYIQAMGIISLQIREWRHRSASIALVRTVSKNKYQKLQKHQVLSAMPISLTLTLHPTVPQRTRCSTQLRMAVEILIHSVELRSASATKDRFRLVGTTLVYSSSRLIRKLFRSSFLRICSQLTCNSRSSSKIGLRHDRSEAQTSLPS